MKQILLDFGVKNTTELNKVGGFKMMLLNICKYRNEKYMFWRSSRKGFDLITDSSYCEFEWTNGDYNCVLVSMLHS